MSNMMQKIVALGLVIAMSACGGGGGSAGTSASGSGSGSTAGTGTSTGTTSGTIKPAILSLTLNDSNKAVITSLSGGQTGTITAKFVDSNGVPIANAVVKYSASDTSLVTFTPASGSALTDATGVATISVKPTSFDSAGALNLTADAISGTQTGTASTGIGIGAAPIMVGTLSFSPVTSSALPAFSTTTLNIPLTSNGQPVTSIAGVTVSLTSDCVGAGSASLLQGSLASGILNATYTNKGCTNGTDNISVSIGNSKQSTTLAVSPSSISTIQFVGTDSAGSSLVLKGSGGIGRNESSIVTFKVVDQNKVGLSGVTVNFVATTNTGGLTVLPALATTDSSGLVQTTVSSGTIPTPVKIIATATRGGSTISGLSDNLTISTGLPIQKAMSLSVDKLNIEGWDYDGVLAKLTVLLADQYGNPISDNTTVNFIAEGAAVGSSAKGSCDTSNGGCTVDFKSQNFRPVNGRVTVLAYAQGVEDFVDSNGDGQYSCSDPRDSNGNSISQAAYRPLVDNCPTGAGEPFTDMGDPFLDAGVLSKVLGVPNSAASFSTAIGAYIGSTSTLDGVYTSANGDLPIPFKGTTFNATGDGKWGINYIRRSVEMILSSSYGTLTRQVCSAGICRDWTNADGDPSVIQGLAGGGCSTQTLIFRIADVNNNPLPSESKFTIDSVKVTPKIFPDNIGSTNAVGGTFHSIVITPDSGCAAGSFTVIVATPKGNKTAFSFKSN